MYILYWLWKKEVLRYSDLKRALGKVTPKVEYSLIDLGKSMMLILSSICRWGSENIHKEWEL